MNDNLTNRGLSPKRAIIIYHDHGRSNFYLETRDIKTGSGGYTMSAPVPISVNTMKDIAKAYTKTNVFEMVHEPLIPSYMLHGSNNMSETKVVWYRPSMKRKLNFASHLKITGDQEVMVPATLYLVINKKLYVYALDSDKRPSPKSKLYNAPYFNIYVDGNVCLGTAQTGIKKAKTFEAEADRFERAFYMAEQNGGHLAGATKTNLPKLWTSLIKSKQKFPVKELIQHSKFKTLADLLNKLVSKTNISYNEEDFQDEIDNFEEEQRHQ